MLTGTILLTGFEAFGKVDDNPSQRVVEQIAARHDERIVAYVLPVEYQRAGQMIRNLMQVHQPTAVLMLGVAQGRDAINLERIALNLNDAHLADNAGDLALGRRIETDAPAAYWSTLPLDALHEQIAAQQIAVRYSNHAGAYLCNHVFYVARHWLETQQQGHIPCGFIHLPAAGDEAPAMPVAQMTKAVDSCLSFLMGETAHP
jgi:pyroglutamyl-peptidase